MNNDKALGCDGDMIVQNGLVFNNGGFRLSFSLSRRGARFLFYFFIMLILLWVCCSGGLLLLLFFISMVDLVFFFFWVVNNDRKFGLQFVMLGFVIVVVGQWQIWFVVLICGDR